MKADVFHRADTELCISCSHLDSFAKFTAVAAILSIDNHSSLGL